MKVLHLNDKVEIIGGVEIYIKQLTVLMPMHSMETDWIGIYKVNGGYKVKSYLSDLNSATLSIVELIDLLKENVQSKGIDVIHVHSISDSKIIEACFDLAPVIRSMHEPRLVCPGHGKFWRKTERVCTVPFGLHCLYHIYAEGCSNRHPSRITSAMLNTHYEINIASKKYKSVLVMSNYMKEEAKRVNINEDILKLNPYFTLVVEDSKLVETVDKTTKHIVFIGRFATTKGVHYFINVGLKILQERNDVVFDLVGDGQDREQFEKMIPEKFQEKFIFHGWKTSDEIFEIIAGSYLMIFPSIYPEAFGISGIESMMHGKPVIGFDVGGVNTWLKQEKTGFLVPSKDIEEMTKKVFVLLEDKSLYCKMSREARKTALAEFSPDRHMKKLKQLYFEAINN